MIVEWKRIEDTEAYVRKTLAAEADDIPAEKIDEARWVLAELESRDIEVDQGMIDQHDRDPIHIARKNNFIELITRGEEILPLIILGPNRFLVDGYARFRALRDLGISKVLVCKQE